MHGAAKSHWLLLASLLGLVVLDGASVVVGDPALPHETEIVDRWIDTAEGVDAWAPSSAPVPDFDETMAIGTPFGRLDRSSLVQVAEPELEGEHFATRARQRVPRSSRGPPAAC